MINDNIDDPFTEKKIHLSLKRMNALIFLLLNICSFLSLVKDFLQESMLKFSILLHIYGILGAVVLGHRPKLTPKLTQGEIAAQII
jgi:hypothetical protein